jgi:hypothetical protein
MDKIIVEYQLKTEELRKELGDVKKQLSDTEKQVETSGSKMSNVFKNIGAAVLGAFAVREVVAFGREVEALARKAEGVEKAFKNIANAGTLEELRKATRGTVSDLQLMQNAVKANNFQIPLDQLGKLFAFANQRARETGESVDYLVDSIVLGIGRKSPLILDNLGISAIRLREEFKGLGVESAGVGDVAAAVGRIIDEEMGKAANSTTEAADAADRAAATYENLKVELGKKLTPVLTQMRIAMNNFLEDTIMSLKSVREIKEEVLGEGLRRDAELTMVQFQQWQKSMADVGVSYGGTAGAVKRYIEVQKESLAALKEDIKTHGLTETRKKSRDSYYEGIKALEAYYDQLTNVNSETKNLDDSTKDLKITFDDLYPPVDAITKAMTAFGEAFAIMRQSADGIYVGFGVEDLERTAAAIGAQAEGLELLKGTTAEYVDTTQEAADWTQAWFDISSNAFMGLSMVSDQQTQKYIDNLQAQFDAGQITQEQFDRLQDERLRKNARQQKSAAIFDIILSTAQAIMKALSLGNVPASVAAGVAGAIQLGVAVNAPVPAFAEGVVGLNGEGTETSDSILARLSKGESVITAKGTRQDKGLFEAANKMKLEEYINKNYVLPVLLKKQQDDKAMFDDYRLYRSLQDLRHSDKANTRMIVNAIKTEKVNSRRYWA